MESDLTIDLSDAEGPQVLRVSGFIDASTVDVLDAALAAADPDRPIDIDMSDVGFMDSSGINVLVTHWRRWGFDTAPIILTDASSPVRRVLEISGLAVMVAPMDPSTPAAP
ncbi:MAG TPA: STAS domain-containing protein [Acidimicrobiales bacterium]